MRTDKPLRSTLFPDALAQWLSLARLPLSALLTTVLLIPLTVSADEPTGQPELAVMNSAASASVTASDPLGQLLRKLDSDNPVDSAVIDSAVSPDAVSPDSELAAPSIDLWERIRRGFKMEELTGPLANQSTSWYAAKPDYIDRMSTRAARYLYHIVREIEKRNMPTELALLPFVESAMQPEARSAAKAAGLWQFIPSTGKLYQLEQTMWTDERRDVIESTRAALDYLEKLYSDFGDWQLALAAYNCGEGCVGRAVEKNRRHGKPIDYTSLRLPRETEGYVPKLQAIKNIVRDPQAFGITLPEIKNEPYFVALRKTRDFDVITAARLAEMPVDEFRALNPSLNRPVIVAAGQARILLPADRLDRFIGNLAAYEATGQALSSWTTTVLKPGDTLAAIAAQAGISEEALREANRIPAKRRVAAGSAILIPRDETMDEDIPAEQLNASLALMPEAPATRRITYRVRRGESLAAVAQRWNVGAQDIVTWNRLKSQKLFAGQRVNLIVAASSKSAHASVKEQPTSTRRASSARHATGKSAKPQKTVQATASKTKKKPAGKNMQVAHGARAR